jgi:3'-phosphoadenosine 5'-phosphosulfate sulfotransferase (PAPS reductase)/FAD synthetase
MPYYSQGKEVKEPTQNKTVAIATHVAGAEVIVKALNVFFGTEVFSKNRTIELMHENTAFAFRKTADFIEQHKYTGEMTVEYLRETADVLEAQAMVVSLRDELKIDKPKF